MIMVHLQVVEMAQFADLHPEMAKFTYHVDPEFFPVGSVRFPTNEIFLDIQVQRQLCMAVYIMCNLYVYESSSCLSLLNYHILMTSNVCRARTWTLLPRLLTIECTSVGVCTGTTVRWWC